MFKICACLVITFIAGIMYEIDTSSGESAIIIVCIALAILSCGLDDVFRKK